MIKLANQNKSECQLYSSDLWSQQSVNAKARQCHQEIDKTRNACILLQLPHIMKQDKQKEAHGQLSHQISKKLKDKSAGSKP